MPFIRFHKMIHIQLCPGNVNSEQMSPNNNDLNNQQVRIFCAEEKTSPLHSSAAEARAGGACIEELPAEVRDLHGDGRGGSWCHAEFSITSYNSVKVICTRSPHTDIPYWSVQRERRTVPRT